MANDATIPEEFNPIFLQQGVLVVGGHAVNLWAKYYAPRGDSELAAFAPFTSKDADIFLPDPEMAMVVAAVAGWEFRHNVDQPSPVVGYITMEREGRTLTVDVMRRVTGLENHHLLETEEIKFEDGRSYVVPPPELMLQAKIWNATLFKQERRQDVKHVGMMVVCCRHYLTDASRAVVAGRLSETETLGLFESTRRIITSPEAIDVGSRYRINLAATLPPLESIGVEPQLARIRASYAKKPSQHNGPRLGYGYSP